VRTTTGGHYIKDGIVPDVTDSITISNPTENTLHGHKKDVMMSTGDMNSDSTDSELANPSLLASIQNIKHFDLKNKTRLKWQN
jgi:hypothetical protein